MILDTVPYCYKEYPPVPEMQCDGHKEPIRWVLALPVIAFIAILLLIAIL